MSAAERMPWDEDEADDQVPAEPPDLYALPPVDDAEPADPFRAERTTWRPWPTWDALAGGPGPVHGPRRDLPGGRKEIPWPKGARPRELVYFATPDHRPPARVARLVVTEGEKAADAVAAAGNLAAATVCGAPSDPSDAVVELLASYGGVVLAPDNDAEGRGHMARLARRLERAGADLLYLVPTPDDAPEHWDLADVGPDRIRELVDAAHEIGGAPLSGDVPAVRPARMVGIDAADLLELELPPLRWIVPELIPEGTTVLAAPPKVGKSCLVYQVAVEASIGGEVLGRRVQPGAVLYLALEDGQRRGQERLRAALAGRTMPRGRLEVRWAARTIGDGLEDDIREWLDEHPDAAMVAIDTLGKVRPAGDGRRNAYEVDVQHLARLQDLFRDRSVALVIVHHARKEAHDDFLASVSGTYGITGSADTIVVVRRKRLEAFGTLLVTGRDVPDAEIPARFDGLTWQLAPASLPEASFERMEVYRAIEGEGPIFPQAIADRTGLGRTSVQNMVGKLVESGAVARTTKGYVVTAELRARDSVPDDCSDCGEEKGVTGVIGDTRARKGTAGASATVSCRDYAAHQSRHRRTGDRWVCDTCEGDQA